MIRVLMLYVQNNFLSPLIKSFQYVLIWFIFTFCLIIWYLYILCIHRKDCTFHRIRNKKEI